MIQTDQLTRIYHTKYVETAALQQVSLDISEGEFVSLMGPSGSGKSTLLRILGLLDQATSGSYLLDGSETVDLSPASRHKIRLGTISFVFQDFCLIDDLTIAQNVSLPLRYQGVAREAIRDKVEATISSVGISHRQRHFPSQLSGGEQQRAAIARALVTEPKLLLADEPTGNLDQQTGLTVLELLSDLNTSGCTVAMATHSQECAAFSSRVVTLKDGRVAADTGQSE